MVNRLVHIKPPGTRHRTPQRVEEPIFNPTSADMAKLWTPLDIMDMMPVGEHIPVNAQ